MLQVGLIKEEKRFFQIYISKPSLPLKKKIQKKNKIVNKFRKFLYILHAAPTEFSSTICKIVKFYIYFTYIYSNFFFFLFQWLIGNFLGLRPVRKEREEERDIL